MSIHDETPSADSSKFLLHSNESSYFLKEPMASVSVRMQSRVISEVDFVCPADKGNNPKARPTITCKTSIGLARKTSS